MRKTRPIGGLAGFVLIGFLASCANPQGPNPDPGGTTLMDVPILSDLPPDFVPSFTWIEGFEAGLPGTPWSTAGSDRKPAPSGATAHGGSASLAFTAKELGAGQTSSLSNNLTVDAPANLRFWLRTDIGTDVATDFSFSVDGVILETWNGLGGSWFSVDTLLAAGNHLLQWTLSKDSNSYYPDAANAVWLDDVSIAPDGVAVLHVDPAAQQELVAGGSLAYRAIARRSDGSEVKNVPVTWELVAGTGAAGIDGAGLLTASAAGSASVRAASGAILSVMSPVSILPAGWLDLALVHQGTAYAGKAPGGSGNALARMGTNVAVSSPTVGNFSADAFFTIRGSVSGTGADQYAWISLDKIGGTAAERSSWFVRGDFALRLWLRFGPGEYSVNVYPMTVTSGNLGYEGDILGWRYSSAAYAFTVSNTRQEDGRFRYPSDPLQADALAIRNLAARLVLGRTEDRDRLLAIHDFTVSTLRYDDDSLVSGARKKQDALSSLTNGMGVCEGYTSLFGALARAAGFEVKAVAGSAGGGSHAWNLIFATGAWPMVDCTWDDPGPNDGDPASVRHAYFLVPGPDGSLGDHTWLDDRIGRALGPIDVSAGFGSWPAGSY